VCWLTLKVPSLLRSRMSAAGLGNVVTLVVASRFLGALGAAGRGGGSAGAGAAAGGGSQPMPAVGKA